MLPRMIRTMLALTGVALLAGVAAAGSIKGTVKYEGSVPNLRPIKMDADPGCAKKHSSPVQPDVLVLGDGNTLANVMVHLKSGVPEKAYPVPSEPVVLDQRGCQYHPHVVGVMVGQTFKVVNSDGLLHNVHALPQTNKGFNRAMPASVTEAEHTFDTAEFMFKIKCDVHPWMGAYVGVMSNPFFDVTGTDGTYEIKNVPAGTYEVEIWHEKLGTKTARVTVSGDETQTADFVLAPPSR